jgi:hypothetical protein
MPKKNDTQSLVLTARQEAYLIKLYFDYRAINGISVERLPYTDDMAEIALKLSLYVKRRLPERDVWWALQNLRKKGALKIIKESKE